MRFSLIGSGFIMPRHAEAIYHVGGKIIDVVNTAHGNDEWMRAVENPDADCIVVLTPNDLHFPIAEAAASRGKIVLCEKPLSLTADHVMRLAGMENVFSVLQLRHHPLVETLRAGMREGDFYGIRMDISVYRDPGYYEGWKGNKARSGGILFNLGSHYFDLLLHLFGAPEQIIGTSGNDREMAGTIIGTNWACDWHLSTDTRRDEQRRVFTVNDVPYNFSSQDNLSYENLHRKVYEDLVQGKGVRPGDVLACTELISSLYAGAKGGTQ